MRQVTWILTKWNFQATFLFRNIKKNPLLVMNRDFKKVLKEIKLARTQDMFRVCFRKREPRAIRISIKKGCLKCQICVKGPKSYLKIQYSWNYLYLDYFYLGIQAGSRGMNDIFGLLRALRPRTAIWPLHRDHSGPTEVLINKKNMTAFGDFSHPHWFVPYILIQAKE